MANTNKAGEDIAKPGETPAEATSRPVIVSKGPAIQDPMVNPETNAAETQPAKPLAAPSTAKKIIKPLAAQTNQPSSDNPVADTNSKAEESTDPLGADTELPEEVDESTKAQRKVDQLSEEDLKRQELTEKLIVEKKYFVPIGAVHQKQANRAWTSILILLILAVCGGLAAIDAELISTSIKLPFDLIQ